jgi:hypothetical protein
MSVKLVSVLFVRSDSVYKTLGVDCWDIERDARKWPGGNPIVAHPPCRAWGQLSHMAKPRPDEKELAIFAINMIRQHGGVLEHPRASKLWPHMNLPKGDQIDEFGGFSICVNQSWWGHLAQKKTMLYICGIKRSEMPAVPIRFDRIDFTVTSSIRKNSGRRLKGRLTTKHNEGTPIEFAKWLIELADKCRTNENIKIKDISEGGRLPGSYGLVRQPNGHN